MLATSQRLRRRDEFTAVVRSGSRAGRGAVVAHIARPDLRVPGDALSARVGFVIPRSVGTAVVRNKVRRRLRHLARAELIQLPPGTDVVIRALPGAADRTFAQLGSDLAAAITAASDTRRRTGGRRGSSIDRRGGGT